MSDAVHKNPEWLALAQTLRINQTEAAEIAGVSQNTIHYWEKKRGLNRNSSRNDSRLDDADWLREQYHGEERSLPDIADELGCTDKAVHSRLQSFNINTRKATYADADPRLADADWLHEQYHGEKRSISDIADDLGCTDKAVHSRLQSFNINTRKATYADADPRLADVDWLHEQYHGEKRSSPDIADELNCSKAAVLKRLKTFNIETRMRSQHAITDDELEMTFDSRWERDVARALEAADVDWEHHPEPLAGWEPDFLVEDRTYIEVKGMFYVSGTPRQYAGITGARWAGAEVIVVGTEEARRKLPYDSFVPYDGLDDILFTSQ